MPKRKRELARITDVSPQPATTTISNGWPARSWTSIFARRLFRRNGDCDPDWSARPAKLRNASVRSKDGVDLLLLQCSPQLEEMERFAKSLIPAIVS